MLREDYPIYFDDTALPIHHTEWTRGYDRVQNVNQTEAGTDDAELIRTGKTTITAAFRCTDVWASVISAYEQEASFSVRFYDVVAKAYVTKTMYMSGLSVVEVPYSDRLTSTNGVYEISFNLIEF